MTLRLRRGTDAQRLSITPAEGEAIYTTDTKKVYIGDGTTAGGILVTGGAGGGGGLAALVDDTTPELGGDLDLAGFAVIGSGDISITGDISARFIQGGLNGNVLGNDSTIILNSSTSTINASTITAQDVTAVQGFIPNIYSSFLEGDDIVVSNNIIAGNVIEAPNFRGSLSGELTGSVYTNGSTLVIDGETGDLVGRVASTEAAFITTRVAGSADPVFGGGNQLNIDGYGGSDINDPQEPASFAKEGIRFRFWDGTDYIVNTIISAYYQTDGSGYLAISPADQNGDTFTTAIEMDGSTGDILLTGENSVTINAPAISASGSITATSFIGSVFGDDSTELVDAVNGTINLENTSIETLLDVNIVSPTTNQVLKYDGANWVNAADAGAAGAISINGVTQAATGVVTTDSAHGLYDGQSVTIVDVVGMTELNGNDYYADVLTSATFGLYSDAALTTPVDTSGFTLYDSAGTVTGGAPTNALTLNNQSAAYYLAWTNITSKPTTISGYGISDAVADFADLGATPTTLAGYGISDAVASSSISVFGASLIDDADDTTARTTLGLGTAATTAATDYATAAQGSTADTAVQPAALGNFTFTGSVLDSSDSSSITVTPAVTMSSDLTVENDLRVTNTVYAERFESTSTGTPEIVAAANLDLTAGNAVRITSSVLRLASFTSAERDALAAQNGDVIYNTSLNKFQGYENGAWANLI